MLHFLKPAWRSLAKQRTFTFLNLAGLSIGLACALLIYLWVADERRVDHFNTADDRVYQVMENSGTTTTEQTPGLLAGALSNEIPAVAYSAALVPSSWADKPGIVDRRMTASAAFASRDWFHVISYKLVAGDADAVLASPDAVVLSKATALKLFNTTDVVGRTINWNQKDFDGVYRVTGVFEQPETSTIPASDMLFSYALFLQKFPKLESWSNNQPETFVRLRTGAAEPDIKGFAKANGSDAVLFLQRFSDRYLHGRYENGKPAGGRIAYVRLFSLIALFILFIACINFMNLSTARAAGRMKEVGIRKVMGAGRAGLIGQFMGESLLLCFGALVAALLLASALLPAFNTITGKSLGLDFDWGILALIAGATALVAGAYPAFYLSRFNAVSGLKGKWSSTSGENGTRRALVVFQFALSTILIVAVLVIYRQFRLIETLPLGYDRENVVYFEKGGWTQYTKEDYQPGGRYPTDMASLLSAIRRIPGVVSAANFRHNVTNRDGGTYDISWPGKDPQQRIDFTDLDAGLGFAETLGMQLVAGRFYRDPADVRSVVVNETAVRTMGLHNPVGQTIRIWGQDRMIIGVVKDFHFQSLYDDIKPCFLDLYTNQWASKIMVRLAPGHARETLDRLQAFYRSYTGGYPFDYRFLDADYQALYASERRVAVLSRYFAGLAILISCLGLFGLAAFTAQRRRKEIGIRKVVGAGSFRIVLMLCRDFLRPVLLACLVAFPVGYLLMRHWLDAFAYRVPLGFGVFALSFSALLLITLSTVGLQSWRAARAKPVDSLTDAG